MGPFDRTPLNRTIVRLAIPTILMNISTPLLGAVDTAVVGHLEQVYHLGAVSVGSLVFTLIYFAFNFFRMSTIGLAAQAYGKGDEQACVDVLGRALLLGLVLGLGVIALRRPIMAVAVYFLEASPEVERYGAVYFHIRALAAPPAFFSLVFQGWFYGVQNVAFPVLLTVLVNLFNIGLDFLFVVGWGYASDGVAWATVISQYLGLAVTLGLFGAYYGRFWRRLSLRRVLDWRELRAILTLNGDIFLRTLSLQFANVYFLGKSAALGDLILAANTILLQMRMISAYALDGFATAAEVVVGNAVGSGDRSELLRGIRLSLWWGLLVGGAISVLYGASSPWWPAWYTSNDAVLALVRTYMAWVILETWISNVPFILDGIFVGATGTRTMRNAMVLSVFGVFLPAIHLLSAAWGNHGMWAATILLYAVRGLTLAWPLRRLWREPGYRLR